eukprot:GDKJ01000527.1.p1 GENE.GDKJ01000527.1~~GDKJ01000527.1.p1  ORF type:complete len:187 (+),score=58.01 GDKJ01000527.1:18-578(+)
MASRRIALLCGSIRSESINRKLGFAISKQLPAHYEVFDVKIDDLPLYNGDFFGKKSPAPVQRMLDDLRSADGFIIMSPEHNRCMTAALKNAIDWASKPAELNPFINKVTFVSGTSPGAMGASFAQAQVKMLISGVMNGIVVPGESYIQFKPDLITADGFIGEASRNFVQNHMDQFVNLIEKISPKI